MQNKEPHTESIGNDITTASVSVNPLVTETSVLSRILSPIKQLRQLGLGRNDSTIATYDRQTLRSPINSRAVLPTIAPATKVDIEHSFTDRTNTCVAPKVYHSVDTLPPTLHLRRNDSTIATHDTQTLRSSINSRALLPTTAPATKVDIEHSFTDRTNTCVAPMVYDSADTISRDYTKACCIMNVAMAQKDKTCVPICPSVPIAIPHRHSLPLHASFGVVDAATVPTPSLSAFLTEHIIKWVSYNPGICSFGFHLAAALKERLDLTIIEPNEACAALNNALLPDALVLQGDLVTLQYIFGICKLPRDGEVNELDFHHCSLPIASPEYSINGINLHFFAELVFPLSPTLPPSVKELIQVVTTLDGSRNLQYFIAFWPLSHYEPIPLRSNFRVLEKALVHWSLVCKIIYAPLFGDTVAASRFMILGNHRTRSEKPLVSFDFSTNHTSTSSGFAKALSRSDDDSIGSTLFAGDTSQSPNHNPITPRIIADTTNQTTLKQTPIVDERYPAPESVTCSTSPFRILHRLHNDTYSRPITPSELFRVYFPLDHPPSLADTMINHLSNDIFDILRTKSCPYYTASLLLQRSLQYMNLHYDKSTKHVGIARCLISRPLPTTDDWREAYASDKDTNYLIGRLKDGSTALSEEEIRNVHAGYRHALRENRISFRKDRLLLFTTIGGSDRFLCLIIVPTSLRQLVFFAYHASGSGAHMKAFKTLLLIRLRFFWPSMRKSIMLWVKGCAGCIPAAARNRESSGLLHSWPITTPFCIVSVDIWKPGEIVNVDGYRALLNAMCDMTQFVVTTPVKCLVAAHVARAFMEGVLLKVGLCVMVVVDEGREFCALFQDMCKLLNIKCHVVAKRNHKAVGVERYHRFLNHSQRICSEERGTPASFVECGLTTAYAWNASPIDGTDILRSVPAIGRELRFPLDIHESEMPSPITDVTRSVVDYIQYLGRDVSYARGLLSWLVADRREAHRERANSKKKPIVYRVGDIVMGRVAVQSSREKGVIQKLVYQSRGPYVIERVTGYDTYYVRRYGKPQSALQKFMSSDLFLLPPQILPCEHVDTPSLRYLNSDFAPLRHPFSKNFDIESYNTSWFDDQPISRPPDFLLDESFLDTSAKKATPLSQAVFENQLLQLSNDNSPATEMNQIIPSSPSQGNNNEEDFLPAAEFEPIVNAPAIPTSNVDQDLIAVINNSCDKLFFVRFTPSDTLRPKWFLVQVVIADSNDDPIQNGNQFCTFLHKHPKDKNLADDKSRWWPEWRELIWDDKNDYDFGDRILFGPLQKPDLNFFGKFGTELNFNDPETVLVGPFNFVPRSPTIAGNCFISDDRWKLLYKKCISNSLTPPTLSSTLRHSVALASVFRRSLADRTFSNDMITNSSLSSLAYFF